MVLLTQLFTVSNSSIILAFNISSLVGKFDIAEDLLDGGGVGGAAPNQPKILPPLFEFCLFSKILSSNSMLSLMLCISLLLKPQRRRREVNATTQCSGSFVPVKSKVANKFFVVSRSNKSPAANRARIRFACATMATKSERKRKKKEERRINLKRLIKKKKKKKKRKKIFLRKKKTYFVLFLVHFY